MAAEVFGSIVGANGVEDITLNNAATESTLRQLLASSMSANKQTLDSLKELAKSAGLDPVIAERAGQNINELGDGAVNLYSDFEVLQEKSQKVRIAFDSLMSVSGKLVDGTATLSGILNTLGGVLPKQLGFFVEVLSKAADFQAASLQTYQAISASGANFSGNLMEMRLAAAQSYLTLGEFTNVVKNNSSTLAKMGGSVNDGVRAFAVLNKSLISSPAGEKLLALGLTAEEVSNGMLTFINATGGRTKTELGNVEAVTAATSTYLLELDKLSKFSGISRKEQEELQKKAALSGAYQLAQSKMTDAQVTRTAIGLAMAQTQGADAVDLYMARIAGLPTAMTAGGLKFQGMFGSAAQGILDVADSAKSTTGSLSDMKDALGRADIGLVQGVNNLGMSASVMALKGDQTVNQAQLRAAALQKQGADEIASRAALNKRIEDEQAAQAASQASEASAVTVALKKLGAEILSFFEVPLAFMGSVTKRVAENLVLFGGSLLVIGGILAAWKGYTLGQAARATTGGLANARDALFGGFGRSKEKPLWVQVVPGGGRLDRQQRQDQRGGNRGGGNTGGGGGGNVLGALKGGLGGVLAGITLGVAADAFKSNGMEKTGAGLDIASQAASFAGTGALLGALGGPLGAAIGGIAGGVIGTGIGLYQNSGTLFGSTPNIEKSSETKLSEPKLSEEQTSLVASYQKRTSENSDRMILILRELIDISREQNALIKGSPVIEKPKSPHYGNVPTR